MKKIALYIVLALPMDPAQWIRTPVSEKGFPPVAAKDLEWEVTTMDSAGGYGFLFKKPVRGFPESVVGTWKWRVMEFPKAKPVHPFTKEADDYPIRMGWLISDGKTKIKVPGKLGAILEGKEKSLSHILFYGAVQRVGLGSSCGESPYLENAFHCVKRVGRSMERVETHPLLDLIRVAEIPRTQPLEIIGAWVFADSDNSSSSSRAFLSDVKVLLR